MEINGLPLHALAVHAAVVLAPLSTLAGLAYAVPRFREWVRWPLVVVALLAGVAIWVAYFSGEDLLEHNQFFNQGDVHELVEKHEDRAAVLRIIMTAFAVVTVAAAVWLHSRSGAVRWALAGLVVAGAVLTGVWTVLTGDAGAQIAWQGVQG